MKRRPDAGYGEAEGEPKIEESKWEVEKAEHFFTNAGFLLRVIRNEKPVGMIRVANEEEFRWLQKRIAGTFNPKDDL